MTSNGMLVAVAHWAATKLHYSRDTINWNIPLAFIFILWMEQMFQDKGGHMINLQDREMIDSGEYDRQMSIKRMTLMKSGSMKNPTR